MNVGECPLSTLVDTAGDEHAWREIIENGLAWRFTDQDLAWLSFDSSLEPAGAWRSEPAQPRVLIFTTTPLSLEVELMADRVAGQIVPPGPGQIVVETPGGILFQVEADDIGFFDFAGRPRGQVRLRCETPTGRLVTDWLCL